MHFFHGNPTNECILLKQYPIQWKLTVMKDAFMYPLLSFKDTQKFSAIRINM